MKKKLLIFFAGIAVLTIFGIYVDAPSTQILWPKGPNFLRKNIELKQGLDLKGGSHLVYEADLSKLAKDTDKDQAISGAISVLTDRINGLGVAEATIQPTTVGNKEAIIIELPGVNDLDKAKQLIGSTAKLEFKDPNGVVVAEGSDLVPGAAQVTFNQQQKGIANSPVVDITFNSKGKNKFAQATSSNVGKIITIELDGKVISSPTVQTAITDGKAIITGDFTVDSAKFLAIQLNAGALPIPIKLIEERTVGASLGTDSIKMSLLAGLIGMLIVFLFMIFYYKLPGLLSALALIVYAILVLAVFKLLGIVLTLAGIAAFIIGIGTAVDGNILIFERMKEELRDNKSLVVSIQEGFKRAWSSIRDGNTSHILVAIILIWFGTGSVRGFAIVLIISIIISLFTAISVSRIFLLLVANSKLGKYLKI
ncbi:MAG: hypothetical protein UT11_C0009G0004 [Berkelbacteria bacterium GW2011_GWA2_38_9]|uniref:Protein translocase subunit SecD n=1 Tax=Berkelbacteria bacterium GW2011_GWA2_38_9 TaxID=1618334 RepID=A0A0G0PLV1_9BACT|nr:MAG: hypothetical protein UT11_C0009G0004 [Berkelbacteria bacterium GW2011_GWA2_38_9]